MATGLADAVVNARKDARQMLWQTPWQVLWQTLLLMLLETRTLTCQTLKHFNRRYCKSCGNTISALTDAMANASQKLWQAL